MRYLESSDDFYMIAAVVDLYLMKLKDGEGLTPKIENAISELNDGMALNGPR